MQTLTVTEGPRLDQRPLRKFRRTPNRTDSVPENPTMLEMLEEIVPAKWMQIDYRLGLVKYHSLVL
jgi:hypothetical protein